MKFGILKDIKNGEFRVIATPTEVGTLVADGNEVYVASGIQNRPWIPPEKILKIEGQQLDPAPKTTVTRSDNYYEDLNDI